MANVSGEVGSDWRRRVLVPILLLALVGTLLGVGMAFLDLSRTRDTNGDLIQTGPGGPAAEIVHEDFPDARRSRVGEHDGPMFYAIARAPMDLDEVSQSLDRPRYRLQHPLFAWAAWILHPSGGGPGLLSAFVIVGVLALFGGGVATGLLARSLGGPLWLAAVFPILPGAVMSVRITVGDTLAVALMLGASVLFIRGRTVASTVFAVLAVLTKEPMWLTFVGLALWRRDGRSLWFVGVPAAVALAWMVFLRLTVPTSGAEVIEFVVPLTGFVRSWAWWLDGDSPYAFLSVVAAVVVAIIALVRRRRTHPLWWPVAINLAFVMVLDRDVLGLERNGTRMSLALLVLGLVALTSPGVSDPVDDAPLPAGLGGAEASGG